MDISSPEMKILLPNTTSTIRIWKWAITGLPIMPEKRNLTPADRATQQVTALMAIKTGFRVW
jgi:hypothetical protein